MGVFPNGEEVEEILSKVKKVIKKELPFFVFLPPFVLIFSFANMFKNHLRKMKPTQSLVPTSIKTDSCK